MNKVFLIGNLTDKPVVTTTSNGIKVGRFTLAVSRNYSKDGKRETDFLPVVVWRAQAQNCYDCLNKGSRAAVCGSIQTRSYVDKDNNTRYVTEIVADEVQFLSTKGDDEDGNATNAEDMPVDDLKPVDDNLPF